MSVEQFQVLKASALTPIINDLTGAAEAAGAAGASPFQDGAEAARDTAIAQAATATTQAGISTTQAGISTQARIDAQTARSDSRDARDDSQDARDLAQHYRDEALASAAAVAALEIANIRYQIQAAIANPIAINEGRGDWFLAGIWDDTAPLNNWLENGGWSDSIATA